MNPKRTTIDGYEITNPIKILLEVMVIQLPLLLITFYIGATEMPNPLKLISTAMQSLAFGIIVSYRTAIWHKTE